jgi:hypothetical protein
MINEEDWGLPVGVWDISIGGGTKSSKETI